MKPTFFSELLPELAQRATLASVSRLGFSNPALRQHLMDVLVCEGGRANGAFLGEPVFEATFGWQTAEPTLTSLAPHLLPPKLVDALDRPAGEAAEEYRFARTSKPYRHQLQAWQHLLAPEPQSVVVTSGTGSGKTECFMVPVLSDLAREQERQQAPLVGVRALFLYPLNALIQSQRERLSAWTGPFGGALRYCLYNGNTPEIEPKHKRDAIPQEVIDRQVLRQCPPPILVTNPTMLEYMLVRAQDAPILQASQGKLRWIVLDEAHSYIGSQAAEVALMLRRVLHAFDVTSGQVRFVATSATIGDPEGAAGRQLRSFLAQLAGVNEAQVHLIAGQRQVPTLNTTVEPLSQAPLVELEALPQETRYSTLEQHRVARAIRRLFVPAEDGKPAVTLDDVTRGLPASEPGSPRQQALRWLDLLTSARSANGTAFLPLRLHVFHNVLAGLWACADPACPYRQGTALDSAQWRYGRLYTEQRRHCRCGAPAYELRSCNDCNETFLWAEMAGGSLGPRLIQPVEATADEFSLEVERPEDDEDVDVVLEERRGNPAVIANGFADHTGEVLVERTTLRCATGKVPEPESYLALRVREQSPDESGELTLCCPACNGVPEPGQPMFRNAVLGAPFLLGQIVPTLLEFCPDGAQPLESPRRGRRMITFTDSRQGTARIAANLQQDAERNRVRGLIMRRVHQTNANHPDKLQEITTDIDALEALPSEIKTNSIQDTLKRLRQQRADLQIPVAVGFKELAETLASHHDDVRRWMHEHYAALDPEAFGGINGVQCLTRLLLIREFGRRPKRLNSLETMGLVRVVYPKLRQVAAVPVADGLGQPFTLEEWRQFLKIALDFHVRASGFVDLPPLARKWGGQRATRKGLLRYDSTEQTSRRLRRWPQCATGARQPRLVRLLAQVLRLAPEMARGRDQIDTLLRQAWHALQQAGLLQSADGVQHYLAFDDLAFEPVGAAWVCPVTRRVLDVTLRGITPYLPEHSQLQTMQAHSVTMPACPVLRESVGSEEERLQRVRAWLSSDPIVAALRREGLWSDLSDRVVEGGAYFRMAEHSAQQSGARLQEYEQRFKSGRINVLSCSTTMEMGVDIGGISIVAMNNVPPHPANYLQRAGRAGRRGETRAVALTVCKSNPHDQHVLANTRWPFDTALPTPAISLSSPVLVQRHVTALLLAQYLKAAGGGTSAEKLTAGWWMLPEGESRCERFIGWAQAWNDARDPRLTDGLRELVRHSCFEGTASLAALVAQSAAALTAHRAAWMAEYGAVQAQIDAALAASRDTLPAVKALSIQRKRLTDEYLLRELAAGGVLPGHGFPTSIVAFDTLTVDEIKRMKTPPTGDHDDRRKRPDDDKRLRRRELPNRDAVTALREYAPGADVVLDGLVYHSGGITLNWHAPASAKDVTEIQNIRSAWRCGGCGRTATTVAAQLLKDCPECGFSLNDPRSNQFSYLEPAGFAVDLCDEPHNDVSTPSYVPAERPWISAEAQWRPLPNLHLGRFRTSTTGSVFHYSSGREGLGYAVCLDCGRAAPMEPDPAGLNQGKGKVPASMSGHRRLRGAYLAGSPFCTGSDKAFSIKPALRLGHEITTDVIELLLFNAHGQPLRDAAAAYSLSVAIRSAIATRLGVQTDELACDSRQQRLDDGSVAELIVVFDRHAAGYCSSIGESLDAIMYQAREVLACSAGCDSACQHCLLQYDTRFEVDRLDRHAALAFLTPEWLAQLRLPVADALLGPLSKTEPQPLAEAISRESSRPAAQRLRLYLGGNPAEWDLAGSPLRWLVQRWAAAFRTIDIVLPVDTVRKLAHGDRLVLALLAQLKEVTVRPGQAPVAQLPSQVVAEVHADGQQLGWASRDARLALPDEHWGEDVGQLVVRGPIISAPDLGEPVVASELLPPADATAVHALSIDDAPGGNAERFGAALLDRLETQIGGPLVPGADSIIGLTYYDRYLNAPLPVVLLVSFVSALKIRYRSRWAVDEARVHVAALESRESLAGARRLVHHNWATSKARDAALRAALGYCGQDVVVHCTDKREARHARMLELATEQGNRVRLYLDQGFSYWSAAGVLPSGARSNLYFPFEAPVETQGETIAQSRIPLSGQSFPTYLFVERD